MAAMAGHGKKCRGLVFSGWYHSSMAFSLSDRNLKAIDTLISYSVEQHADRPLVCSYAGGGRE